MKVKIFLIDILTGLFLLIQLYPPLFSFIPSEKIPMISTGLIIIAGFVILFLQVPYRQFLEEWNEKKIDQKKYVDYLCGWFLTKKERYFLIDVASSYFDKYEINAITYALYKKLGFDNHLLKRMQNNNIRNLLEGGYRIQYFVDKMFDTITGTIHTIKGFIVLYGCDDQQLTLFIAAYVKQLKEKCGNDAAEDTLLKVIRACGGDDLFKGEEIARTQITKRLHLHLETILKDKKVTA